MTSLHAAAPATAASANTATSARPHGRPTTTRRPIAGAVLATALIVGAIGATASVVAVGAATAAGQDRFDTFVARLEHARRVDDLRNQQLRWVR